MGTDEDTKGRGWQRALLSALALATLAGCSAASGLETERAGKRSDEYTTPKCGYVNGLCDGSGNPEGPGPQGCEGDKCLPHANGDDEGGEGEYQLASGDDGASNDGSGQEGGEEGDWGNDGSGGDGSGDDWGDDGYGDDGYSDDGWGDDGWGDDGYGDDGYGDDW
jgi:hypothetical protein